MRKLFSVASWNVEHFRREPARMARVIDFIKTGAPSVPDVFALYEVEGKDVYRDFMDEFPDHRFHLTEGKQTQEIFVGVHKSLQSFVTQRIEFKTGRDYQRPGLLVTVRTDGKDYPLLFLHVKSGAGPEDFGLRDAALDNAFDLKKALDKFGGDPANFIFLGDLNTMGVDDPAPYQKVVDLSAEDEIARIAKWAGHRDMTLLTKETADVDGEIKETTWWSGGTRYDPANLDHVVASEHMKIRSRRYQESIGVSVLGWPHLTGTVRTDWLESHSDHAMLYFEVCE